MATSVAAPLPTSEAELESLRIESNGIEDLLTEAEALAPAEVWQLVDEAVRRLVRMYGVGLDRALGHARAAGADGAGFDSRLADDPLVASLLVLHGIHPQRAEERIRAALAKLSIIAAAEIELAALDIDGAAYIRAGISDRYAPEQVAAAIKRAVEAAAPELQRVRVRCARTC